MEPQPLISVITVTYNAEKVIGRTLRSLKEQSFTDYEYLVIDGNSQDATIAMVKDANIPHTSLLSEPDKGLYDAMNKGLRLAKGKYVIFLNAGDTFHSCDTLSLYASEVGAGKDIIYGDTVIVDHTGKKIADRHLKAPQVLTSQSFSKGMLICHQAFMVKKELAPLYDLNYRLSADYDWCVKCIRASSPDRCANLNQITIDYLSDGLTDNYKWKSLRERFGIMSRHYGLLRTCLNHFQFIFRALKRGNI